MRLYIALCLLFLAWSASVSADTFFVTNANDSGAGSLRNTLAAAPAGSTVIFESALSGATIPLDSEIVLEKDVVIDASNLLAGLTINGGAGTNRIFTVTFRTSVDLRGLTFTGGNGGGADFFFDGHGGAIMNSGGTLTVSHCTFSDNSAEYNGGAINNDGVLTLSHCTFSGNSAAFDGGALSNDGTLTITHCTLSDNSATNGGGIANYASPLTLAQSIIAGNRLTGSGHTADIYNVIGTMTRVGANIIQSPANVGDAGPDAISADPLLAPLGEYGGPTQTMALLPGSPARNASSGSAAMNDQRGFSIVGTPDIGAYEAGTFTNYDAWIWESLPATATVAEHATTADFDGDSTTNVNEWLALTDPANPASQLRITNVVRNGVNLDVTFSSVTDRNYTLESSTDLAAWNYIAGSDHTGTGAPITVPIGPVTGIPEYFVRVRVGP